MEPKFSLLIANFNNGHYFSDCFRSLIAQTEKNWEAIVIDDASTDNSVEIISEMIKGDERFRFFQNEKNLGYQHTLVRAIELSQAEIFGRLDPDDALYPGSGDFTRRPSKAPRSRFSIFQFNRM